MSNNILVTGSNRGIGKCLVEEFLSRGVSKVYAAARNIDTLKFDDKIGSIQQILTATNVGILRRQAIIKELNLIVQKIIN